MLFSSLDFIPFFVKHPFTTIYREGQQERLLTDSELSDWAARIDALCPQLTGPIYFLWGTDWEDAPVVNAKKLQASLPMSCRCEPLTLTP